MSDELLDTRDVAKLFGMSEVTLRKWRIKGDGPRFVRLGRAVRYLRSSVDAWMSAREFANTTEADVAEGR